MYMCDIIIVVQNAVHVFSFQLVIEVVRVVIVSLSLCLSICYATAKRRV